MALSTRRLSIDQRLALGVKPGRLKVPQELCESISRRQMGKRIDIFEGKDVWSVQLLKANGCWWAEYHCEDGFIEVNYHPDMDHGLVKGHDIYTW